MKNLLSFALLLGSSLVQAAAVASMPSGPFFFKKGMTEAELKKIKPDVHPGVNLIPIPADISSKGRYTHVNVVYGKKAGVCGATAFSHPFKLTQNGSEAVRSYKSLVRLFESELGLGEDRSKSPSTAVAAKPGNTWLKMYLSHDLYLSHWWTSKPNQPLDRGMQELSLNLLVADGNKMPQYDKITPGDKPYFIGVMQVSIKYTNFSTCDWRRP